jgi:exonuclease III
MFYYFSYHIYCDLLTFVQLLLAGDVEPNPGPRIKSLNVLQVNARSLKTVDQNKNKIVQFKSMIALRKPHIVSVCETWLTKKINSKDILAKSEYEIYRKDRSLARGGGVCVAVSKKLKSKRRDDLESQSRYHNEILAVEIQQSNGYRVGLISLYKPPDELNYEFANNLRHTIEGFWRRGIMELLVMGDINFPDMDWDTGFPKTLGGLIYEVAELFQEYGLTQLNRFPSRMDTDNILDVVLSNHPMKVDNLDCFFDILSTDHAILEFQYDFDTNLSKGKTINILNMARADFVQLRSILENADWSFLDSEEELDSITESFQKVITDAISVTIPLTKIRENDSTPWIDHEVIHLSHRRETMRKRARRSGRRRHWRRYQNYSQRLKNMVHNKFNSYIAECTDQIANNPRKFWSLVGSKMGDRGYPDTMTYAAQEANSDKDKAALFNAFFTSNFTQPQDNIIIPELPVHLNPLLEDVTIEENEVRIILSGLNTHKAMGPDSIPTRVLKECADQLVRPLTKLFNLSLTRGTMPSVWKIAKVCPVFKKGSKTEVENYRPISLLNITSKILEKCIFDKIIEEIDPQLGTSQHGFRKGRSTVTQMLEVYHNIGKVLDSSGHVDAIFLDLSKAFDTVSHEHLMAKLRNFGFGGNLLEWMRSYLTNRKQFSTICGENSELSDVLSGVPQGSILGPLLFIIFINDMPDVIDDHTSIALYADDAKVFREIKTYEDALKLQEQLDRIVHWSNQWLLKFNARKCKVISFTRKLTPIRYHYNITGTPLERVRELNDLGLQVQDNLLWDSHIRSIVSKANKYLYFIIRALGFHAPVKAKKTLYLSLVRSQIEYGTIIWSPFTKTNLELIERVQRKATRYICNYANLNYKERLTRCDLVPLSSRREILDVQFAHKGRSGVLGEDIRTLCTNRPHRRNVRLDRGNSKIRAHSFQTETFSHFYTNRLPSIWNGLPEATRVLAYIPKSTIFKSMVRRHFQSRFEQTFDPNSSCTWVSRCRCPTCRQYTNLL